MSADEKQKPVSAVEVAYALELLEICLLYTSDAADE